MTEMEKQTAQFKVMQTEKRNDLERQLLDEIQKAIESGNQTHVNKLKRHFKKWLESGRPLIFTRVKSHPKPDEAINAQKQNNPI